MLKILCPVNGKVVINSKISDPTFSQNMMGETVGIIPSDGTFVSPIDGKIILCEGHAFAIEAPDGTQVLIHIGIDTVKIDQDKKAQIFKFAKKLNDQVKAGDKIVDVDLSAISQLGYDLTTPVVILAETIKGRTVSIEAFGSTNAQEVLFSIS